MGGRIRATWSCFPVVIGKGPPRSTSAHCSLYSGRKREIHQGDALEVVGSNPALGITEKTDAMAKSPGRSRGFRSGSIATPSIVRGQEQWVRIPPFPLVETRQMGVVRAGENSDLPQIRSHDHGFSMVVKTGVCEEKGGPCRIAHRYHISVPNQYLSR